MVEVKEVKVADKINLSAVNELLPQLSKSSKPMKLYNLDNLVKSNSTFIYFAFNEKEVVGMLSLVVVRIPTGTKVWIEDVVVDENSRGKGIGRSLMNHALEEAGSLNAKCVDLTSRPNRVAANRLYQSIGFKKRETNIYRFDLSGTL